MTRSIASQGGRGAAQAMYAANSYFEGAVFPRCCVGLVELSVSQIHG